MTSAEQQPKPEQPPPVQAEAAVVTSTSEEFGVDVADQLSTDVVGRALASSRSQPQLVSVSGVTDKSVEHLSMADVTHAMSASTDTSEKAMDLDQVTSSLPDVRTLTMDDVMQPPSAHASQQVSDPDVTQQMEAGDDALFAQASPSKLVRGGTTEESLTPKQETSRQASCEPGAEALAQLPAASGLQLHKSESLYAESLSGMTSTESTLSRPKPKQTMNFENLKHELDQLRTTSASRMPDANPANPAHAATAQDGAAAAFNSDANYHTMSFLPSGVAEELHNLQQHPRSGSVPNLEHAFTHDPSAHPMPGAAAPQAQYAFTTQPLAHQDASSLQAYNAQLSSLLQPGNMVAPSSLQTNQLQSLLLNSMGLLYPQYPLASQSNIQTATMLQMLQLQQAVDQQNAMLRQAVVQLLQQNHVLTQAAAAAFTQTAPPTGVQPNTGFVPSSAATAFTAPNRVAPEQPPFTAATNHVAPVPITMATAPTALTSACPAPIATSSVQASLEAIDASTSSTQVSNPPEQPAAIPVAQQPAPVASAAQAASASALGVVEEPLAKALPKEAAQMSPAGEEEAAPMQEQAAAAAAVNPPAAAQTMPTVVPSETDQTQHKPAAAVANEATSAQVTYESFPFCCLLSF